ncbi:MAG: DUF892 family protein [Gemmatimonadetes bacterium]|nr:DUF892 family protein [Gemmatimonadota bacterium]
MPANTLKDLLRYVLGGLYQGEQERLPLLDALETETHSRLLRDRLRQSREEARQHTSMLERCFELFGSDPPRVPCAAVRGLAEERRSSLREGAAPPVLEAYHMDVALRCGAYMAAAYRSAAAISREAGQGDITRLLEASLREELDAAAWIETHRAEVLAEVRLQPLERALAGRSG